MTIDINKIMYYGEHYEFSEQEMQDKYPVLYWLRKEDYIVLSTEELINNNLFDSCDAIANSDMYIPMFRNDTSELQQEFIKLYFHDDFDGIFINKNDFDKYVSFMKYIDNFNHEFLWHEFKSKRLAQDAIVWCEANNLPYKIESKNNI